MTVGNELRRIVGGGRVADDETTLRAYSTDASIYYFRPQAVVFIDREEQIPPVLRYASEHSIPLTLRGAGTGLAGGALGNGILMEFSRYRGVIDVDVKRHRGRVKVGTIYEDANRVFKRHNLMFAPDPSSGDSCQIGGMLANNSSGPRTVRYGTTKDHVLEIKGYLASGQEITIKDYDLDSDDGRSFLRRYPQFERIMDLCRANRDVILSSEVRTRKNSSGYNLADLVRSLDRNRLDLPKLFVNSEGTLALFTEAVLNLVPLPGETATALVFFNSMNDVGRAVLPLLDCGPSSLEIMDSGIMDLIGREKYGLPAQAKAMLLVEVESDDLDGALEKVKRAVAGLELSRDVIAERDPERQQQLWKARKATLPTLYLHHPRKKPISFVEDAALPPEKVPEMLQFTQRLFGEMGLTLGAFGHIGDGNIHLKALADVNDPDDFSRMQDLQERFYEKVISMGGTLAGEHGDGRLRAPFLEKLFGSEVYHLFLEVKRILDPQHILNPDVKLSIKPSLVNLDKKKLNENCSSCGKCNPYCASYEAFLSDGLGSRGRLRALTYPGYTYADAKYTIEHCLNCKSCRIVCPAECDTSRAVVEARSVDRNRFIAPLLKAMTYPRWLETAFRMQARAAPLWESNFFRVLLETLSSGMLRLDRRTILPRMARTSFRARHFELANDPTADVAYFYGCADNGFDTPTAEAVLSSLHKLGFSVSLPDQGCCGLPMHTHGYMDLKIEMARMNIRALLPYPKIVTGCGSCLLALREYAEIIPDGDPLKEDAVKLAEKCYEFSEFVMRFAEIPPNGSEWPAVTTYHDPCHLRAAGVTREPRDLLRRLCGKNFVEMDYADRCCGYAGTYYIFHPVESERIFRRKRQALEQSGAAVVTSSCPTCLAQFANLAGGTIQALHPAVILDRLLPHGR